MSPSAPSTLASALRTLSLVGVPLTAVLVAASFVLLALCATPLRPGWRRPALAVVVGLLAAGEGLLLWFHIRLYEITRMYDAAGHLGAGVATPMWIESEKLYLWAIIFGVMALLARRHREELTPVLGAFLAVFASAAVLVTRPFTEPLPQFVGTLKALFTTPGGTTQATQVVQQFQGLREYYMSPFMWVHPPLLFFCYGAFVASFAATVVMIRERREAFETTAYRWARLGYLPLTAGILLGFPWALTAWKGTSWWWTAVINMTVMMWLLYTAYLHGRLYLRRKGMWRWVAVLAVLAFVALMLTFIAGYVIPGAHSVAPA